MIFVGYERIRKESILVCKKMIVRWKTQSDRSPLNAMHMTGSEMKLFIPMMQIAVCVDLGGQRPGVICSLPANLLDCDGCLTFSPDREFEG